MTKSQKLMNSVDLEALKLEWEKKLEKSGHVDIFPLAQSNSAALYRSQSHASAAKRWWTPEKEQYYLLLWRFSIYGNFREIWPTDWRLFKHIARLYARGLTSTQVAAKVNAIYGTTLHRDSISRYMRTRIKPAMWLWHYTDPQGDFYETTNAPDCSVFEN